ncbi:PucR family transcriptional regulator [Sutcliffiella cohnii]|uniref:PucR family transcriptional regulator n=1 Tax=Sutcliffiella cohnii TaxID=33932 RepID=UPI002E234357|nr:PucR family transcriptional regulator ligand-binding domain-containing protein [Sutcliffiella cohnii]
MGIEVREAIKICGLKHGTIVAGSSGLNREIEHVSVIEIPDSHLYFQGAELFLTAFSHFTNNIPMQLNLLDYMHKVGSAALAILQTETYISQLDSKFIEKANTLEIPIILFPEHIPYIDIISPILKAISFKNSNQVSYLFKVQKELIEALIRGNSFGEICHAATNILGNPLCFVNQNFDFIDGDRTLFSHLQILFKDTDFNNQLKNNYTGHMSSYGDKKVVVQPIFCESKLEGYLVTLDRNIMFHEDHISALQHISLGFALKIQEERKLEETKRIHKRDFFEEILTSKNITSMHLDKGNKLGFDLSLVNELLVVHTFHIDPSIDLNQKFFSSDYYFYTKRDKLIFLLKKSTVSSQHIHKKILDQCSKLNIKIMLIYSPLSPNCRNISDKYNEIEESIEILKRIEFLQNLYIGIDSLLFLRFIKEYRENLSVKDFITKTLGPLIKYDHENQTELLRTLETILFIEDTQVILDTLYIHRNTLINRKKKIHSVLGYNVDEFPHNLNVRLACIFWKSSELQLN